MRNILCCSSLQKLLQTRQQGSAGDTQKSTIEGEIVIRHGPSWLSRPGLKLASVQIYSNSKIDQYTGHGFLSDKVFLKGGRKKVENNRKKTTYKFQLEVVPEFGIPGAFRIENRYHHEFFLESATLSILKKKEVIRFDCGSWVYPIKKTKSFRVFFSNASYLPQETPNGLKKLREYELKSLRGELAGQDGERKEWDRIYNYDTYNDLGDPDGGRCNARPVLGGPDHPYPRRLKTGPFFRTQDHLIKSRSRINAIVPYIPPDERLDREKLLELKANLIKAIVYFLIPAEEARVSGRNKIVEWITQFCSCLNKPIGKFFGLKKKSQPHQDSGPFKSFDDIFNMFSDRRRLPVEGWVEKKLKKLVPNELYKEIVRASRRKVENLPLPSIIAVEKRDWRLDEEFGRQTLAGTNPTRIQCLQEQAYKELEQKSQIFKEIAHQQHLDCSLEERVKKNQIFILDHHDYLFPYLSTVQRSGVCAYASRTLLYFDKDWTGTLMPLAIELSSPHRAESRVFLPPKGGVDPESRIFELWELAKAHVAANDSAYHLLVSHWLQTHAVVEPFIIATRRRLSVMHPIHRLLDPHFKDTIHINGIARAFILNSEGILEKTLFTGIISMELSSDFYRKWRFDEQALPKDLLRRNMAKISSEHPTGVKLIIDDYPYAVDGLDIWVAIKTWVTDFCQIFYKDDESVRLDKEVKQWWDEIRSEGHGDRRDEGWYDLTDRNSLIEALTTIIWMASALHAAVNFGQYAYAGYPPNRPTMCQKFIPEEGPLDGGVTETHFLEMLPGREEMEIVMALTSFLSHHTSDEIYLGQRHQSEWFENEAVSKKFNDFKETLLEIEKKAVSKKFNDFKETLLEIEKKAVSKKFNDFKETLVEIEKKILKRNKNYENENRWGSAKILYKLLYPDTSKVDLKGGITVRGIPNSISI